VIFGTPSTPLAGNALGAAQQKSFSVLCEAVRDGTMTAYDVAHADPYEFVKHHRGIERLQTITTDPMFVERRVMVFYGKPGSGKTRSAYQIARENYAPNEIFTFHKIANGDSEWWEGYTGQKCIVIDEMLGCKITFDRILQIMDQNPVVVPFKGGSAQFAGELIIITSNKKPSEWYGTGEWTALRRRIHRCSRFILLRNRDGSPKVDDKNLPVFTTVLDKDEMCPETNDDWTNFQDKAHREKGWWAYADDEDPVLKDLTSISAPRLPTGSFLL